jgi:hypothetical protein
MVQSRILQICLNRRLFFENLAYLACAMPVNQRRFLLCCSWPPERGDSPATKGDWNVAVSFRMNRTAVLAAQKRLLCVLYLVLTCSMLSGPLIYNLARWLTRESLHVPSLLVGQSLAAGLLWVSSRLWYRWALAFAWVGIAVGGILFRKALLLQRDQSPSTAFMASEAALPSAMAVVASALIVSGSAFLIHRLTRRARHRPL